MDTETDFTRLRQKAQKRINAELERINSMSAGDKIKMVENLSVYQVELEMINEQLRDTQVELERSKKNYAELFENAPVGYIVFSRRGIVEKVNQTAAAIFGTTKKKMEGQPFLLFLSNPAVRRFFDHLEKIFKLRSEQKSIIELRKYPSGENFWAKFVTSPIRDDADNFVHFRTAVIPVETAAVE